MLARCQRGGNRAGDIAIVMLLAVVVSVSIPMRAAGLPVASWWPAGGVATWLMIRQRDARTGLLAMAAIFGANLCPDLLFDRGVVNSLLLSAANTVEAATVGYLFSRHRPSRELATAGDVWGLMWCAAAGAGMSAVLGAVILAPLSGAPAALLGFTVFTAHLSGQILVLCLVLISADDETVRYGPTQWFVVTSGAVVTAAVFTVPEASVIAFLPLCLVVGAAFVISPRHQAAVALTHATIVTVWAMRSGWMYDPDLIQNAALSVAIVQIYLICLVCLASPVSLAVRARERAYERESKSRETAEDFARLRSDLLRSITHELRTPLTTILGYSELALRPPGDRGHVAIHDYAPIVQRNGRRLLQLVNDVIDTASPADDSMSVQQFELRSVVDAAVSAAAARGGPAVIVTDTSDGPLIVQGLPRRLARAIEHAIANACAASAPCGRVVLSLRATGSTVRIQIADDGRGFAPGDRERLFEPFFRTLASRAAADPGVGLGMSVLKRIVEEHHGCVDIARSSGWTLVTIDLPRVRTAEGSVLAIDAEESSSAQAL